ncbi:MAG: helix-turn-helix domain-containing protein [Clostridia bacterium]|nr:helix-turn-helix domain-containing protein [Clostridia bacterium]
MLISERIKAARKECKLTQQQVADILGLDRSTYSYYELGHLKPSVEVVVKLCAIFNADIGWLTGADRADDTLNSPDYGIELIKAAKEQNMSELSRNERKFVALLRAASAIDREKDIFEILMSVIKEEKTDDEK